MAVSTTSGSVISIGSVPGASVDTAGEYAALTYVAVGEVENLGEFGDTASIVSFLAISNARVRKSKGSSDAGTMELVVGRDPLDAGQIALRAAARTKFAYAFKVEAADKLDANDTNSFFYFRAYVTSAPNNFGGSDDITRQTFALAIDSEIYEVPATVVA